MKTIKFIVKCAGRESGEIETWADETQAAAFVEAGGAEYVETEVDQPAAHTDRAMAPPPRGKGSRS